MGDSSFEHVHGGRILLLNAFSTDIIYKEESYSNRLQVLNITETLHKSITQIFNYNDNVKVGYMELKMYKCTFERKLLTSLI